MQETLDDPYLVDVHAEELAAFEQEILNARADQAAWREIMEKLEASAKGSYGTFLGVSFADDMT